MKQILIPCDFSKPARNAFRIALDIAQQTKGRIHLLNVIEIPVMNDPILASPLNFEQQLLKDMKARAESEFKKLITRYGNEEVKVITSIQPGGVYKVILEYILDNAIDVVLMGSHGASGFQEMLVGSNAEKIVRRSPVPVLIVKDYYKGPIKNIVFPNTLETEGQDDLIEKVKALQNFLKAYLHIVWINTLMNFASDRVTTERLESFVNYYKLNDYTINIFSHPTEEEGILQFTKFIKGDLIAMGTHGRRGIAHLVNGSLAEDVVNHSEKMVWTYTLRNEVVELDRD